MPRVGPAASNREGRAHRLTRSDVDDSEFTTGVGMTNFHEPVAIDRGSMHWACLPKPVTACEVPGGDSSEQVASAWSRREACS